MVKPDVKTKTEICRVIAPALRCIVDAENYLGETPVWSPQEESLYWVNCEDPPAVHRYDTNSAVHTVWSMPERIGGLVLKRGGDALVTLASGIYDLDFASGELSLRVASPLGPEIALHECACDRTGRLWVGSLDRRIGKPDPNPGGGSVFSLKDGVLVASFDGVSCSNGLAFSPDGRTLYHSDSPTGQAEAWTLDPIGGALSNRRSFIDVPRNEGSIDGSTVDADGGYWTAIVFGREIRRYFPDGTLDLRVTLPFANPTKLSFGGPDMTTLFVTTTKMRARPPGEGDQLHGGVYAFEAGFRGLPEPQWCA